MLPPLANAGLVFLIAVSGCACIAGELLERRNLVYFFKPATMLLVLALAVQGGDAVQGSYLLLVVAGLLFSLAGDVFLMLPQDRFVPGLVSFLVGHLFYVAAFAGDGGGAGPLLGFLPFVAAGVLVYAWLRPGLGAMGAPVAVYVTAIAAMAGFATARWLGVGGTGALLACAGAILFVVSDSALAANRFRRPFAAAPAVVLGTYFAAQCLIALSTGVGEALLGRG
ncbi:MAG: lysoplasmalogenase [Myxococcota bacterium]|nr:lysoplasmalogenase [Myxococcota bacterium]